MTDFLFRGELHEVDPQVGELCDLETERQVRKLILIPSESTAPLAVRQALASSFQNIYAEGYPTEESRRLSEAEILDYAPRLAEYRRFSDPRYYKGVEYADVVEALARRRCAEAFATNGLAADDLFVNVQALSGAPANNAVFHALLKPGEVLMGMNLLHGGHLTHGSPASRSGKLYTSVSYSVDPQTEQIDYDAVEALALEARPKIIIAGYSSYPWVPDWQRFRAIADAVGAYLMADIAHIAGLVVAGACPSPVGVADVVTFTTHKSLCGPRGAAIVTHKAALARKIDRAVFPGEQGGPHINTIAAQAVAFKLATSETFRSLQRQIIENCVALTEALQQEGFRIPFGGTNTHLTNVDCGSVRAADGAPLSGDMAARILDVAGIVVNRNTIPGDSSALNPSAIRLGTPWITQRGFTRDETSELGRVIAGLLKSCRPFRMTTRRGEAMQARVEFKALEATKISSAGYGSGPWDRRRSRPAWLPTLLLSGRSSPDIRLCAAQPRRGRCPGDAALDDISRCGHVLQTGYTVECSMGVGADSKKVWVRRESQAWSLFVAAADSNEVLAWLRGVSDAMVALDPDDSQRRVPGPVVVEVVGQVDKAPKAGAVADGQHKPWYAGAIPTAEGSLPPFAWQEPQAPTLRRTALFEAHKELGAKIVDFAGWEMPVWYTSVIEEHLATRQAAGLFDVSHMGVYQVEGPEACAFLDFVVGNDVDSLDLGESLYTQFLDPEASVIDDTMIYRVGVEAYLVVVNASNDDKDWAWLHAVREGRVRVDDERPGSMAFGRGCKIRNLRDPGEGPRQRVDIALQGPKSRDILLAMGCDDPTRQVLERLPWAGVMSGEFGDINLIVSRTGYTGERVAYELFVHPKNSLALWHKLLEFGTPLGMKPVGLGAAELLCAPKPACRCTGMRWAGISTWASGRRALAAMSRRTSRGSSDAGPTPRRRRGATDSSCGSALMTKGYAWRTCMTLSWIDAAAWSVS